MKDEWQLSLEAMPEEPPDGFCGICRLAWKRIAGVTLKEWAGLGAMMTGMPEAVFLKCSVPQHKWIEQFTKSKKELKPEDRMIITGGDVETKEFELPPVGTCTGVCAEVVGLGWKEREFRDDDGKVQRKWQEEILVIWQLDELDEEGNRFVVHRSFTKSVHPNSGFRKFLNAWRGDPFTEAEAKAFDTDRLIGVNGLVSVVHKANAATGKTRANVGAVVPLPKKSPKIILENYSRPPYIDKFFMGASEKPNGAAPAQPTEATDQEVPF